MDSGIGCPNAPFRQENQRAPLGATAWVVYAAVVTRFGEQGSPMASSNCIVSAGKTAVPSAAQQPWTRQTPTGF
ncbi:hypothetical protein [Mameliella sp.]